MEPDLFLFSVTVIVLFMQLLWRRPPLNLDSTRLISTGVICVEASKHFIKSSHGKLRVNVDVGHPYIYIYLQQPDADIARK